jgi:hypothetical protein
VLSSFLPLSPGFGFSYSCTVERKLQALFTFFVGASLFFVAISFQRSRMVSENRSLTTDCLNEAAGSGGRVQTLKYA